jgi:ectoine hydroxylase
MQMALPAPLADFYPSRQEPQPRWLQRRDPVVHGNWREPPIEREMLDAYARDGYLVLEDFFTPQEARVCLQEALALRTRKDLIPESQIIEPAANGPEAIRSVFAPHRQSSLFQRLSKDERLVNLARFILGDDVYIHQSRINYKPAFCGKEFFWHSDFETWHTEDGMPRMRAVSISVMLTDNYPMSGPTMFMPGSHLHFVSCVGQTPKDNFRISLKRQEYGTPDRESLAQLARDGGIVGPAPGAGSIVLFDCNLMHGSNGNITPYERVNAFMVFNAWSNRLHAPFGNTSPRPEFIAHRNVSAPIRPSEKSPITLKGGK